MRPMDLSRASSVRTRQIEFSSYGLAGDAAKLLESIWQSEASGADAPNFARIVKDSANNVRDALMFLETELLAVWAQRG